MSGIWGIVGRRTECSRNEALHYVNRFPAQHRSGNQEFQADSIFTHRSNPLFCGLGHCRHGVIDSCGHGQRPLNNEDGSVWVVCDGEIFNRLQLRGLLEAEGHVFNSMNGNEVIVHAYEKWQEKVVDHLNGEFGMALWDDRKHRLLLAKDKFGVKPLYYAVLPQSGLAFASEIRVLLNAVDLSASISVEAVWLYLTFGQIPPPYTIYQSVKKLPQAHLLSADDRGMHVTRYYTPPRVASTCSPRREVLVELRHLLGEAVRVRISGDSPVGCLLSGGLDSTFLTALLTREGRKVHTFSAVFPDDPFCSEEFYQRFVARYFACEHHECDIGPMILASLPALVDATQEPFAISSFIPLFHLAQLARNEVAILVSGDGSDELFGGYSDRYRRERRISRFRTFEPFVSALTRHHSAWNLGDLLCRLQRVVALSRLGESMRYAECEAVFTSFQKAILVQPDVLAKCSASLEELLESQCELTISDALEYRRRYDLGIPLVGEMLTKVERATSAASLECRVPFLDQNLVDYACSIPSNMIIQSHNIKALLKDVAKGLVPDCVIRRRKQGFYVPLERWISRGDNVVKQILRQPHSGFDSIIRPDVVEAGLSATEQGVGRRTLSWGHANQLWTIAVLKYWFMNNSFAVD